MFKILISLSIFGFSEVTVAANWQYGKACLAALNAVKTAKNIKEVWANSSDETLFSDAMKIAIDTIIAKEPLSCLSDDTKVSKSCATYSKRRVLYGTFVPAASDPDVEDHDYTRFMDKFNLDQTFHPKAISIKVHYERTESFPLFRPVSIREVRNGGSLSLHFQWIKGQCTPEKLTFHSKNREVLEIVSQAKCSDDKISDEIKSLCPLFGFDLKEPQTDQSKNPNPAAKTGS